MRVRVGSSEASEHEGSLAALTAEPRVDPHALPQGHLSRKGAKWSQQDQTAQRLLRIYLNRWTEANAGLVMPSVAELYEARPARSRSG